MPRALCCNHGWRTRATQYWHHCTSVRNWMKLLANSSRAGEHSHCMPHWKSAACTISQQISQHITKLLNLYYEEVDDNRICIINHFCYVCIAVALRNGSHRWRLFSTRFCTYMFKEIASKSLSSTQGEKCASLWWTEVKGRWDQNRTGRAGV